jgi:hypothetical protein
VAQHHLAAGAARGRQEDDRRPHLAVAALVGQPLGGVQQVAERAPGERLAPRLQPRAGGVGHPAHGVVGQGDAQA